MTGRRKWLIGTAGAIGTLFLVASPALSAGADAPAATREIGALIGQFTPAIGNKQLIARYAQVSAEARRSFRFTPVISQPGNGNRAITVVVRSRATSLSRADSVAATILPKREAPISIAPLAYDLGKSVGLTKFALPDAGSGVDIAALPKARKPSDGVTSKPSRFSTELKLDRQGVAQVEAPTLNPDEATSVDLGAGYRVSRDIKVTAGVRYRQQNDRAAPLADDRRDSQAVYVGTQFRF